MTTFAEFIVNLMQKLGVFYVFSIIFVFIVTYVLITILLKKYAKDILDDNKINLISILISLSIAILAASVYRISYMFSYFLAMFSSMLIILLFSFAILAFVTEKRPSISDTGVRNIFILVLVFILVFVFISFFFAFQDVLIPLVYGGAGGGIYDVFSYIFRAEILIIPFIFVIIGLAIMALGSGIEQKKQ